MVTSHPIKETAYSFAITALIMTIGEVAFAYLIAFPNIQKVAREHWIAGITGAGTGTTPWTKSRR